MSNFKDSDPIWGEDRPRISLAKKLLNDILERFQLERPDGRPIYKYRVSQDEYTRARLILQKSSAFFDSTNISLCAVFALVTAEWYRREAKSLDRVWSDIGVLPQDIIVSERSEIAGVGLRWWRQPIKVTKHNGQNRRKFLLSLALNGGLPSALIVGDAGNRVRRYFLSVMDEALQTTNTDLDMIIGIAESKSDGLPESYRNETIWELTAQLISELRRCRFSLPKNEDLLNPAGWLDSHDPTWRERLPIYLPDDVNACNRLFNDLLTLEPTSRSGGIGLKRYLCLAKTGEWEQGFQIFADGMLNFDALKNYNEGRFRAFFAGTASQLMSREFAQLYRSENAKNGKFDVSSRSIERIGIISPVSFSETIATTLSRDGKTLPSVAWPGGQARVSNCYVLKQSETEDKLELIGTGSFRSGLSTLFAFVTFEAKVEGHNDGTAKLLWKNSRWALWRISGTAIVTSANFGKYRLQCDMEDTESRQLEFNTSFIPELSLEDRSVLLTEGPLRPILSGLQNGTPTSKNQLRWMKGNRVIKNTELFTGLVTIIWEDDEGFDIDRARVLVLPSGFKIDGQIEADGARVCWRNLSNWKVEPVDINGEKCKILELTDHSFLSPWQGRQMGSMRIKLVDPDGASTILKLQLKAKGTVLVDAEGIIRNNSPDLSPAELRGAMLLTDRATIVDLDLRGAGTASALISRRVEGDTPLVQFGDLAQRLLGLSEERGPSVILRDDRGRKICTIRRSQSKPTIDPIDMTMSFAEISILDSVVVARTLVQPFEEHALVSLGNSKFQLPENLEGPCLVYARRGDAILSMPFLVHPPLDPDSKVKLDEIGILAIEPDELTRRNGYFKLLKEAAEVPKSTRVTSNLVETIFSLKGLSPRALDITRDLPKIPVLLCRLLFSAGSQRLDSILGLERDLSFLWMAQPLLAWQDAAAAEWKSAIDIYSTIYSSAEATSLATEVLTKRMNELTDRTIWFRGIQNFLGFKRSDDVDFMNIAQDHVRLHADQVKPEATKLLKYISNISLPKEINILDFNHFSTLVAPVILAGLALDRLQLTPELAGALRDALDIDSNYVSSAFPHCIKRMSS